MAKIVARTGAPGRLQEGWVRKTVDCHNAPEGCENTRMVDVPEDQAHRAYHFLCEQCRIMGRPLDRAWGLNFDNGARLSPGGMPPRPEGTTSEVRVFKPGDQGFASRARQCTPISEIVSTGHKVPNYLRDLMKRGETQ